VRGIMSSVQTSKRRRTDDTLYISDLPIGILVDVSSYLSKFSRAILAVAFTAPSTSWQNNDLMHRLSPISTAIVSSSEWDTLDFVDIEKSLAYSLSDDDLYAVLQCISAHDVLKKLKLTGCVNITGRGLSPLRGSVVLEQIDLSLLKKYESPVSSEIHHSMRKAAVLPILDDIISASGCSLKHILLPYSWKEDDEDGPLHRFANRYNQYQENRGTSCSECTERIRGHSWFKAKFMYHYNTCYDCLKHYCEECSFEHQEDHSNPNQNLDFCRASCRKDYCIDCGLFSGIDVDCEPTTICIGCLKEKDARGLLY